DPKNNWNPDLEELENKVKYNPNIVAILVINPDNPTGAVFSREVLESIVDIANRYNLFLVFDEIYEKLTYDEDDRILLSDVI
ncbi:MAG: aminotransferase class I/II-fold pyridoxal phosphate-dependent enzyme, partial [bacterium]|nr:aminotransferase class I/II-fold pyridoxal phosphate-dependent enzyme [bacterium]